MEETMINPVLGEIKDITECSDIVFSNKMMGDGFLVRPSDNVIVAPSDGQIVTVTASKHAITMRTENGVELIIHIGIDTVELNGKGFKTFVKDNERVKAGQKLMEVDFDYIQDEGYETDTMVVILSRNIELSKYYLNQNVNSYVEILECKKMVVNNDRF